VKHIGHRTQRDQGATAVEYALMLAGIFAVIVASVTVLGQTVLGLFQSMPSGL
jgi:Flp pilus assembly pilin Flp